MTRAGVATRVHELVRRGQRQWHRPRGNCSMDLHTRLGFYTEFVLTRKGNNYQYQSHHIQLLERMHSISKNTCTKTPPTPHAK